MKNYVKPVMNYSELRVEESIAGFGSITDILGNGKPLGDQLFASNWIDFWLKILRK